MESNEALAIKSALTLFGSEDIISGKENILDWLEEQVFVLLNSDFNKLVNILYRIDVYETRAKECFGKQNKEIARCLALLIWERQMEKVKTRADYKNK